MCGVSPHHNPKRCDTRSQAPPVVLSQVFIYLNNIVEQDHRGVKRVTRPMLGGKSLAAAQDTLVGIERMHMLKKSQRVSEAGDEGRTAAEPFSALAA